MRGKEGWQQSSRNVKKLDSLLHSTANIFAVDHSQVISTYANTIES